MQSQNQPIIHTSEPATTPVQIEPVTLPQYLVTLPELLLASAALIRAIADLLRTLRERRK